MRLPAARSGATADYVRYVCRSKACKCECKMHVSGNYTGPIRWFKSKGSLIAHLVANKAIPQEEGYEYPAAFFHHYRLQSDKEVLKVFPNAYFIAHAEDSHLCIKNEDAVKLWLNAPICIVCTKTGKPVRVFPHKSDWDLHRPNSKKHVKRKGFLRDLSPLPEGITVS